MNSGLRHSKLLREALFLVVSACLLMAGVRLAHSQSTPVGSYIGLWLRDVSADTIKAAKLESERGVEVVRVQDSSPAERAGLHVGDILLAYNGETILGQMQLRRLVSETPPARKVRLEYWRNGKSRTAVVVTEAMHSVIASEPMAGLGDYPPAMMFGAMPVVLMAWKVPALGLECEPMTVQLAEFFGARHGVLIRSVDSDSSAEKAGLKAGDVLMSIGNQPINSPRDITAFVRSSHEIGKPIMLLYLRGRKELTAKFNVSPDVP